MSSHKPFCAVMMVLFGVGIATAQVQQNISGTWVLDRTRSESAAQSTTATAEGPVRLMIEQSAAHVRVDRQRRNGRRDVIVYPFNNTATVGPSFDPKATSGTALDQAHAEWKDGRLMLTTVLQVNGMAVTTAEAFTVMSNGRELHVETQVQMHHGYAGSDPEGKAGSNGHDVYFKKP